MMHCRLLDKGNKPGTRRGRGGAIRPNKTGPSRQNGGRMEMTAPARKLLTGAFAGVLALALGAGLTGCSGSNDAKSESNKSADGVPRST